MTRFFFIFCQIFSKNEEKACYGNLWISCPMSIKYLRICKWGRWIRPTYQFSGNIIMSISSMSKLIRNIFRVVYILGNSELALCQTDICTTAVGQILRNFRILHISSLWNKGHGPTSRSHRAAGRQTPLVKYLNPCVKIHEALNFGPLRNDIIVKHYLVLGLRNFYTDQRTRVFSIKL